jgi:hypothetical protein
MNSYKVKNAQTTFPVEFMQRLEAIGIASAILSVSPDFYPKNPNSISALPHPKALQNDVVSILK